MAPRNKLSHIDHAGRPRMVDVGGKAVTRRTAHARAVVLLPAELGRLLRKGELQTPKGPVTATAILAGVMGAKKTAELIPLCHPIPLDTCAIDIRPRRPDARGRVRVEIHCRAATEARTGVEMEALTGAAVAALALYDMGKSVTHGIVVEEIRLLEKTGGKADYRHRGS
jgi:cyclic pyranopterin monophosphate synthase